jgi:hypothetical protein
MMCFTGKIPALILLWFNLIPCRGYTSDNITLSSAEMQIDSLFAIMRNSSNDEEKLQLCTRIENIMEPALALKGSFEYAFDSLKNMGKVTSSDGMLRIYTWNLPFANGTNKYYGFLQYRNDKNTSLVFRLTDAGDEIDQPEEAVLTPDNWYGALIYEIVVKKYQGDVYYTLLGSDPHDLFVARKIIDVVYFTDENKPLFGKPIFFIQNRLINRMVFEYSAKVQMSLRWNNNMNMIIYDHLSPSKPLYTGNHQFYGPDFSYDGLKFANGRWVVMADIDISKYLK